jgi:hypothetical protein
MSVSGDVSRSFSEDSPVRAGKLPAWQGGDRLKTIAKQLFPGRGGGTRA